MTKAAFEVDDEFRQLWADGASSADLAEKYGTTPSNVNKRAKMAGLPGRPVGQTRQRPKTGPHARKQAVVRKGREKPKPAPTAADVASQHVYGPWTAKHCAKILATGGKLSKIGALAAKWGVPERHVLGKWHKLSGGV